MTVDVKFALDRSARRIDADGRLHVTLANISKACVNPYRGSEIPDPDGKLGLNPDEIYQVFRDPAELERGAATFNNMPLMGRHIVVSADDPKKEDIVGSLGTDAVFDAPYLKCSLVVWDADAIAAIESGECKEISCGYRYIAHKQEGDYEGCAFSIKMASIVANHVALVPEGRAGPDVVVADAKLGERFMPVKLTSKKALMASGGLTATLAPLIAADAKMDITGALQGVNRANFRAMKPTVIERLAKDGKLSADAKAAAQVALDAMEKVDCGEDDDMDAEDEADDPKPAEDEDKDDDKDKPAADAECEAAKDEAGYEKMTAKDKKAWDAKWGKDKAARDAKAKDAEMEAKTAKAMDKAIKLAVDAAVSGTTKRLEAIAKAKIDVAPLIGEVIGQDSADAIYKLALDANDIPTDGLNTVALERMVQVLTTRTAAPTPGLAMDAARSGDDWFTKIVGDDATRFGNA